MEQLLRGDRPEEGVALAQLVEEALKQQPRTWKLAMLLQMHPDVQARVWAKKAFAARVLDIPHRSRRAFDASPSAAAYQAELERLHGHRKQPTEWRPPLTKEELKFADLDDLTTRTQLQHYCQEKHIHVPEEVWNTAPVSQIKTMLVRMRDAMIRMGAMI